MTAAAPSDADLIARVLLRDDRHAYATLVRRHQSMLRAFLRRLTAGDVARADDLAQEAFVRAWRCLASYRGAAKFSSWLLQIGYRTFLSDSRRRRLDASSADEAAAAAEVLAEDVPLRVDLQKAMAGLSTEERAALALCYGQELTHEEAARVLEWPLGTVKTHVLRGKARLKERLASWQPEVVT